MTSSEDENMTNYIQQMIPNNKCTLCEGDCPGPVNQCYVLAQNMKDKGLKDYIKKRQTMEESDHHDLEYGFVDCNLSGYIEGVSDLDSNNSSGCIEFVKVDSDSEIESTIEQVATDSEEEYDE